MLDFIKKKSGRGERIRTSGLYVPNVALYQAKLHPEIEPEILANRQPAPDLGASRGFHALPRLIVATQGFFWGVTSKVISL